MPLTIREQQQADYWVRTSDFYPANPGTDVPFSYPKYVASYVTAKVKGTFADTLFSLMSFLIDG